MMDEKKDLSKGIVCLEKKGGKNGMERVYIGFFTAWFSVLLNLWFTLVHFDSQIEAPWYQHRSKWPDVSGQSDLWPKIAMCALNIPLI